MKNALLFIFFLATFIHSGYTQSTDSTVCPCPPDQITKTRIVGNDTIVVGCNAVDRTAFLAIYKRDFSYLVSAVNAALTNQLVISTDKPSISYSQIFISSKKRKIVSGGFAGKAGLSDGVAQLFSKGAFSPVLTFGPRLNIDLVPFLPSKGQYYYSEPDDKNRMLCQIASLKDRLTERSKMLNADVAAVANRYNATQDPIEKAKLYLTKDSLDALIKDIKEYDRDTLTSLQTQMRWSTKKHIWLSILPDFSQRTFNIFDPNNVTDQQLSEKRAWVITAPLSFNFYSTSSYYRPFHINLTYSPEWTNDILNDDYNRRYEKEIITYADTLGGSEKNIFKKIEKKTFYVGKNKSVFNQKVSLQGILFFDLRHTVGIIGNITAFFPDVTAKMNRWYLNPSIGFLLPAIKSDGVSKLNIVANVSIADVFGAVERWRVAEDPNYQTKSWSQRLTVDLRLGVPFAILKR